MNFKLKSLLGLLFFAMAFVFTSCEKENVDKIEEEVEIIETQLTINMRGVTTTTNAYAAYCNNNGKEYWGISTNQALLELPADMFQANEGDFWIYSVVEPAGNFTLAGTATNQVFMGDSILLGATDANATLNITSNANNIVSGDASGLFFVPGDTTLGSFTVTFDADIIQTAAYCD